MKKLSVGFLAVVLALSLGSCSTIETDFETPQEPLLKKAQLKRDATGAYSVDYVVADKTESSVHKNLNSLTNEIHLSKVGYETKKQYNNNFNLDNDKLKIGFIDAETGRKINLTVEDENITLAKGKSTKFLKAYGLSSNNDGTIQLDFEVNNDVITNFVYNENKARYEIHLAKGEASDKVFSRTMNVPDTGKLEITFVNHLFVGKGLAETTEEKPRVIWETASGS
jgi:hypothetical protein